jgi:hypothetical protein
MHKVIREGTLRRIVTILLEDKTLGPAMINVNPVVDPSAAVTDPSNPNFKPGSKAELNVALTSLINNLSDDKIGDAYDSVVDVFNSPKEAEEEKEMKKDTKSEHLVRLAVRNLMSEISKKKEEEAAKMWASRPSSEEAKAAFLARGGKITRLPPESRGIAKGPASPAVAKLRKELEKMPDDIDQAPAASNLMVSDVGGMGLKELAAEFGFKNPNGVLQWINRVLSKVRTRTENFEEFQVLTLEALNDYIEELAAASDPELTPEDVQLMKDNPQIVAELDSFKIYLNNKLRKAGM